MKYEKSSKRLEPQNNCMDRESFEETTHDFLVSNRPCVDSGPKMKALTN